jgi:hypothetical protein
MNTFTLVFDGTGTDTKTVSRGTFFLILSTTAALSLTVWKAGSQIAAMSGSALQQGISWESLDEQGNLRVFDEIRINSAAAQSMQIGVGLGRLANNAAVGNVTATVVKPTVFDSIADVALGAAGVTQIRAADAACRETIITNLDGNASTIRVGDAGVGAANGIPVEPGASISIEGAGAIHAYNPGVAQSVAVALVKD